MAFVWIILIFVVWLALQLFILPKLGIPTCLRGSCRIDKKDENKVDVK
jgi:hypothetical protein